MLLPLRARSAVAFRCSIPRSFALSAFALACPLNGAAQQARTVAPRRHRLRRAKHPPQRCQGNRVERIAADSFHAGQF
jgi:hypothetical protein